MSSVATAILRRRWTVRFNGELKLPVSGEKFGEVTGAQMIGELVKAGRKVGVTAWLWAHRDMADTVNRLNVATSRGQCVVIVVASPALVEPECRSPHQMRLANALCRLRELARTRGASARLIDGSATTSS